jgi:hypothetical protein
MFDELRLRYHTRRFNAARKQIYNQYVAIIIKHEPGVDVSQKTVEALQERDTKIATIEENYYAEVSLYLYGRPRLLLLPVPSAEHWLKPTHGTTPYLSVDAISNLRELIRTEQKQRSELMRLWFTAIGGIIGALTGLVGATIGLLAYFDKLHGTH